MRNKLLAVAMIGMLGISLVACGKGNTTDAPAIDSEKKIAQETGQEETQQEETQRAEQPKDEVTEKEETETYEDNFAVGSEAAAAFAKKIKGAVANQDIEALADLASYPLSIGFTNEWVSVMSRDELIALGAEKIFTPEMIDSIENADESTLSPSMAGFALSANGRPNMVFGVVDGKLAIQGMNY